MCLDSAGEGGVQVGRSGDAGGAGGGSRKSRCGDDAAGRSAGTGMRRASAGRGRRSSSLRRGQGRSTRTGKMCAGGWGQNMDR